MEFLEIHTSDSICFQSRPVEELNKLAAQIDPRLYFAVYYQPKSWLDEESARYNFRTMATNLYGLFHDCGNFIRVISDILMPEVKTYLHNLSCSTPPSDEDKAVLCQSDIKKRFSQWMAVVEAWRSVFCHNNDDQQRLNLDATEIALTWCDSEVPFLSMNLTVAAFDNITEEDWGKLLQKLLRETQEVQWYLEKCLITAASMPQSSIARRRIVNRWLNNLAYWYTTKQDLLLNWIADWYGYYINTVTKGIDAGVYNAEKSFRKNAQIWAQNTFGSNNSKSWSDTWLMPRDRVKNLLNDLNGHPCPRPALPDTVFTQLAQDVHQDVADWAVNHRLY